MVAAESGILVPDLFNIFFNAQRGEAGRAITYTRIVLVFSYTRMPRCAPGWAGRDFEVVAPLANAAPAVRAAHRDTRWSGRTSATLKWL